MYLGFYTPLSPRIFAALRIKKQLVARNHQRVGTDFVGNTFNIDRGNQTRVLAMEALMHDRMDKRGLRWRSDKKNELFVPRRNVDELIAVMRTIPGEEMYLFTEDKFVQDDAYRGGRSRGDNDIQAMTSVRQQPDRINKDTQPTITLKLSRKAIEELQNSEPERYKELVSIISTVSNLQKEPTIRETNPTSPPPTEIVRLPKRAVDALRGQRGESERKRAMIKLAEIVDISQSHAPPMIQNPPPAPPVPPATIPRVTRAQARIQNEATRVGVRTRAMTRRGR
jgi:hypothetical protein